MPISNTNWERLRAVNDKLVFDLPIDITLTDAETNIIENALKKSRWLRANIRSLWRLYKWLPQLESGYYDDYKDYCQTDEDFSDIIPNAYGEHKTSKRITIEKLNSLFTIVTADDSDAGEKE